MMTPQVADILLSLFSEGPLPIDHYRDVPSAVLQQLLKDGMIDVTDGPKPPSREIVVTKRGISMLKEAFAVALLCDGRPTVSDNSVAKALKFVTEELYRRLREKGNKAFVSETEITWPTTLSL